MLDAPVGDGAGYLTEAFIKAGKRFTLLAFSNGAEVDVPDEVGVIRIGGPDGLSVATDGVDTPAEFGPDKNVIWKTPLGPGHSSPVLWGGRIFLTTFEGGKLFAVDRPEAKLEQIRCRSRVLMKPAAFVRFFRATVNASAA